MATGDDPVAPTSSRCSWPTTSAGSPRPSRWLRHLGRGGHGATGVQGYPARKLAEKADRPPEAVRRIVARPAELELDLRVGALRELGRSRDDGERLVLETAARDLLALSRGGRPAPGGEPWAVALVLWEDARDPALLVGRVVAVNDVPAAPVDRCSAPGRAPQRAPSPPSAASSSRRNRVLIVERYPGCARAARASGGSSSSAPMFATRAVPRRSVGGEW